MPALLISRPHLGQWGCSMPVPWAMVSGASCCYSSDGSFLLFFFSYHVTNSFAHPILLLYFFPSILEKSSRPFVLAGPVRCLWFTVHALMVGIMWGRWRRCWNGHTVIWKKKFHLDYVLHHDLHLLVVGNSVFPGLKGLLEQFVHRLKVQASCQSFQRVSPPFPIP